MVLGFNHNIRYKGEVFHVQTEDSGISNPHIITLLYRGGTIIASKKTSYADIIKIENLEAVVEELMKDQHKEMLRRLKAGEFDARAFGTQSSSSPQGQEDVPPGSVSAAPSSSSLNAAAEDVPSRQSLDEIILDYLVSGDDKF